MDIDLPRVSTFLLAWNPKHWHWKELELTVQEVATGVPVIDRWSCGNSKQLKRGDRIFLIRLGEHPKGIMASGTITEGSYEDLHWDDVKANEGKLTRYVEFRYDVLLNPRTNAILSRERLVSDPQFSGMHWDTQMSGVRIPPNVAIHLEQAWIELVGDLDARLPQELESEILFEGARKQITINAYERNEKARRQCITHYGCVCKVCGFDFGKTYGDVGEGYIQVHHIVPLATVAKEYEVNPIEDLIPVCANCHAMIHKRKPAYTIEEVKGFLGYI